ncbi:MAG: amino acid adenylation domain-containing protein [Lysobacteraceae bacterium]
MSTEHSARLLALARREGVGLGTMVLSAWGLLLGKYIAEDEALFGYATSGRSAPLPGIESTIGLFINTLPMRVRAETGTTLSTLLHDVQRQQLDHEEHAAVAQSDIQRWCGARPGQALFDTLVVMENYPRDRSRLSASGHAGLQVREVSGTSLTTFGLNLVVYPGERITLELAYQKTRFDEADVAELLRRMALLLTAFTGGGEQPLSRLSIMDEAERRRALEDWNATALALPDDIGLPDAFERMARERGDASALVFGDQVWSYARLDREARTVAHALRAHGVREGDAVALSMAKGPELIAAMIAIMAAGAAYVPIAVDCPAERRAFIVADSGITCTLTDAVSREAVAADTGTCLSYADLCVQRDDVPLPHDPVAVTLRPQDRAYVIYTSGTTGHPKGVAIPHRALLNFCAWCRQVPLFDRGSRVTQFAPYTFDASTGEIFGALLAGSELHLLPESLIVEPAALQAYLLDAGIVFSAFPPPYLQQLDPARVPRDFTLLTAGSAPSQEMVRTWGRQCRYINGYGPTETTILSTAWICVPQQTDTGPLSIGRPICNTAVYVVDRLGQLCPPGLVGEIWIGGDGVANGYLNRPELDAQVFLSDPWRAGGRIYRTGDLGRWRDDGQIEFVGRRDRQVKLRGFRIELDEIESRLLAHPQVAEAVVAVRGDDQDRRLLAWVVSEGTHVELVDELRAFLRESLPDYMLPQAIAVVPSMPLTGNGKIDVKALPEPDVAVDAGEAPRDALERTIADVWADVLQVPVDRIAREADFFALGGHSLLAMRAVAQLREHLGVDLGVADLLGNPSLHRLADVARVANADALPPMTAIPRDRPLPLSFAQQRVWFVSQLEEVSRSYHIPGAIRLRGHLDTDALRRALDAVVARHEVLRARFVMAGENAEQTFAPAQMGFPLVVEDLQGTEETDRLLQARMLDIAGAPFDLAAGPLLRGRLLRIAEDEHVLLVAFHHIVVDGWSIDLMIQEIAAFYDACFGQGEPPAPLPLQYADYAAWQRECMRGDAMQRDLDHWVDALRGMPMQLELPTDRTRPAQQDYAGDAWAFRIDAETTARLKALCVRRKTTTYALILAAWAVVLGRLANQTDIAIGVPVANRGRAEMQGMVGFFVNTIVVRVDLETPATLGDLIDDVHRRLVSAHAHQQLPFEELVHALQPPHSQSYSPIFQTMVSRQDKRMGSIRLQGVSLEILPSPILGSKFDVSIDFGESEDAIDALIEYATALFDADTVRRYSGYLLRVLDAMAGDDTAALSRLPLVDDAEVHRMLVEFNRTARALPEQTTLHALIEAQVARTPDATAVVQGDVALTYRELDVLASNIACSLAAQGLGPGAAVGLYLERTPHMIAALLGVLKAGAAYVPMDPKFPPERIGYMLEDSAAPVVIAHRRIADRLPPGERTVLLLEDALCHPQGPDRNAAPGVAGDDLAYVLFTSGSTGRPKGVCVPHGAAVNFLASMAREPGMLPTDVLCAVTTLSFDIALLELMLPLSVGARVVLCDSATVRDPHALASLIDSASVTVMQATPATWRMMLEAGWQGKPDLRMLCGGEALPLELANRLLHCGGELWNLYGPTETTVWSTVSRIMPGDDRITVGQPIDNTEVYVVDAHMRPVPVGVAGELLIGGLGVAHGYIGRPDLTSERFIEDRFGPRAGGRLYRTGDLARWRSDGRLETLGRLDFQVKVRGFRIELGEIENCLERHPRVRAAVVVGHPLVEGGAMQLVAYVVPDGSAGVESLRAHVSAHLPEYMVPAEIVEMAAFPLTANGKVDRKQLPAPTEAAHVSRAYNAPASATEYTIAEVWSELLNVSQVSRDDAFFDLGGDSILLIRMLTRLQARGLHVKVADIYRLRTVEAIAAAVEQDSKAGPTLAERLQVEAWPHAFLSLNEGARVLVIDFDADDHGRLRDCLEGHSEVDYVRADPAPDAVVARLRETGLSGLEASDAIGWADVKQALAHALSPPPQDAAHGERLPFSEAQRGLMSWRDRDSAVCIELRGWHSAEELRRAFTAVACEQDLLHAALDVDDASWTLIDPEVVAAHPIPVVRLRHGEDAGQAINEGFAALEAARRSTPLAYTAAWLSLSDTHHCLLLLIDHLIWDGLSNPALRRRLQARLTGRVTPLARRYVDFVAESHAAGDAANEAAFIVEFPRALIVAAAANNRDALAGRAHHPLRMLKFSTPLRTEMTPAEQAFERFRDLALGLLGVPEIALGILQHGRQCGDREWFEHVGMFLDKVPAVVTADTTLADAGRRLAALQKRGLRYVEMEARAVAAGEAPTLALLHDEIMFNFQTDTGTTDPRSSAVSVMRIREKLRDFRGLIFEALIEHGELVFFCIFRGNDDIESIMNIVKDDVRLLENVSSTDLDAKEAGALAEAVADGSDDDGYSLVVRDVCKSYGDFEAVKGVSFRVRKGSCFGILGPNGAGKTSLLAMIEGLVPITSGSISILGMDVTSQMRKVQPRLGVQLQQNNYFKFLTVAQLLRFYKELRAAAGGKREGSSAEWLLERLNLKDKLGFKVDELSGGQKQRLSIAIALLEDPEVIFLDEPTSALDPQSRLYTWEFIEQLKADGRKTIILTTHYMEEAERLCDEIMIMNGGRVIATGEPAALVRSLEVAHAISLQAGRQGLAGMSAARLASLPSVIAHEWDARASILRLTTRDVPATLPALLGLAGECGVEILHIDVDRPTLEDVFLSHTGKELRE